MAKQYFEFKDRTSSKFWEIDVKGKEVTVRYGRIGTDGQATTKEFSSPAAAAAHAEKVVAEKVKKGYPKPSGAGTSAKSSPSPKASKSKGSSKKPGATPKAPSQNPKSPPSKVGIIVTHRIAQRLEIDLPWLRSPRSPASAGGWRNWAHRGEYASRRRRPPQAR